MDNTTRRAAAIAADKLLAAAGYDPKGLSMKAAAERRLAQQGAKASQSVQALYSPHSVPLKRETGIAFPEGLTKAERKAYRKQLMIERGQAYINERGEFITAKEQGIRRNRAMRKRIKKAMRQVAGPPPK